MQSHARTHKHTCSRICAVYIARTHTSTSKAKPQSIDTTNLCDYSIWLSSFRTSNSIQCAVYAHTPTPVKCVEFYCYFYGFLLLLLLVFLLHLSFQSFSLILFQWKKNNIYQKKMPTEKKKIKKE